jgi:hypothetical protein
MLRAWSSQYPHRPIPPDQSRSVEVSGTGRIAGSDRAAQASVALWAFLHGVVTLEAAQVFGESKPASGLEFGLDAWLMAVCLYTWAANSGTLNQAHQEDGQ